MNGYLWVDTKDAVGTVHVLKGVGDELEIVDTLGTVDVEATDQGRTIVPWALAQAERMAEQSGYEVARQFKFGWPVWQRLEDGWYVWLERAGDQVV